ncbi:MAG: hypothetical protein ACRDID_01095 [Ktedonobacterales bacterium]
MTVAFPRVAPRGGALASVGQVWAATRAELVMQWRRWGFWLTFGCVTAALLLLTAQAATFLLHPPATSMYARAGYTRSELNNLITLNTTMYAAMFFGLVVALLVVDRLKRDQRVGMAEVQGSTPQGAIRYALGKCFGNYLATLLPTALAYVLCALLAIALGWPILLLPKFLLAFVLVFVPSSAAAVTLTLLLSSVAPVRIVQVGFTLLWFEFNLGLGWRALGYSILNPSGLYVYPVFFPVPLMQYTQPGFHTSMPLALLNIAALLLTAFVALGLTCGSLAFQRHRQEVA